MGTIFGLFLIAHGLVHLLYLALSRKLFELDPPLVGWPDSSWAFSRILGITGVRSLAQVLYALAIVLFVFSGIGVLARADWWTPLLIATAIYASVVIVLFWDGKFQRMPDKGFIGVLINIAVLVVVLLIDRQVIML